MEDPQIQTLKNEISLLELTLEDKKRQLRELEEEQHRPCPYSDHALSTQEVSRYSRQMLIPHIGVEGQLALKKSKVLIVGVGGLGCPASLYLAAAGVGEIVLVDYDKVELTNLHRQILHSELNLGLKKTDSASKTLRSINSNIKIVPIDFHADGCGLLDLLKHYNFDVVLDCTDNVATRYLINDLCVISKIPLVSGSALQMEGQLTVYNYQKGPCYRCIFPVPPPPYTVTSCGDGGVLGVVPGVIGVLQALEAIKVIIHLPEVLAGRLLLFDGTETIFRNIRLRKANPNCPVCGENPTITKPINYEQFCGAKAHDQVENISILKTSESIGVNEFFASCRNSILLDVRPRLEFQMCHLPESINIPLSLIVNGTKLENLMSVINNRTQDTTLNVYVMCRRGNDSQRAVCKLNEIFAENNVKFLNIIGGLHAYSKLVDSTFPIY